MLLSEELKHCQKKQIIDELLEENAHVGNIWFERCNFESNFLSARIETRSKASVIRNVHFDRCLINKNNSIGYGVFENVLFSNLKTSGVVFFRGSLFKESTFKGKCGRIALSSHATGSAVGLDARRMLSEKEQEEMNIGAQTYYDKVDWALDISEAEFQDCDLASSIPAKKVKRNPEIQGIALKDNINMALIEDNEHISYAHKTVLRVWGKRDTIIVIPTIKNKRLERDMESLRVLREEGIVEMN